VIASACGNYYLKALRAALAGSPLFNFSTISAASSANFFCFTKFRFGHCPPAFIAFYTKTVSRFGTHR
jgi:hypothetical protein